ncbi:MAG: hypothetical protein WC356_00870 [Candidatus Micrarchaeia archaeon]|jgi:hypothetical protein
MKNKHKLIKMAALSTALFLTPLVSTAYSLKTEFGIINNQEQTQDFNQINKTIIKNLKKSAKKGKNINTIKIEKIENIDSFLFCLKNKLDSEGFGVLYYTAYKPSEICKFIIKTENGIYKLKIFLNDKNTDLSYFEIKLISL